MHAHCCKRCGSRWRHGEGHLGDISAHRCPRCRSVEWQKEAVVTCPVHGHGLAGTPTLSRSLLIAGAALAAAIFVVPRLFAPDRRR